jgi:hypothetical protein
MLVVLRKQVRSVVVGDSNGCHLMLNVTMVELQGGSARLSLEVHTDSPVHRCDVSDQSCVSGRPGCPTGLAIGKAGAQ